MKKYSIILIAIAAIAAACAKEAPAPEEVTVPEDGKVVLTATIDPATRTVLASGNKVEWVAGDAISIFDDAVNVEAATTDAGASAKFSAALSTSGPWYALYPYKADATIAAGVITTTVPATQTAVNGSFAGDVNYAVALSDAGTLAFKNALGLIKFTVGADAGIVKVTLSGNNDEVLAGKIAIDYNSGNPTCAVVSDGVKSIEMTGTFVQGGTYYFAVLPQTFSNGIKLTYNNGSTDRVESTPNELVLERSQIRNIGSPDIITFADPEVKAALVAHFDSNSDGEISKAEAEDVTYNQFEALVGSTGETVTALWGSDLSVINTFDELKYFTGLTNADQSNRVQLPAMFRGCTALTSVTIPENVAYFSNYAFEGCTNLKAMELPPVLRRIYSHCFEGCSSIDTLVVPKTLDQISSSAFKDCSSLGEVKGLGDTKLTVLNSYTFQNCSKLKTVAIPATVTELMVSVFEDCSALESFTGGSGVTVIGAKAFKKCVKLGKLPFNSTSSNAITSIGEEAFYGCETMTLGTRNMQGLTTLGKSAFFGCKKVTNFTINNAALKIIQDSTFCNCSALATIRVSNNLEKISNYAFYGCGKLTTFSNTSTGNGFVLPPKVTTINSYAFSHCVLLGKDNTDQIPNFMNNTVLTTIGNRAFRYCATFAKVELPASVTAMTRPFGTNADTGSVQHMKMTELKLNSTTPPNLGSNPFFENWAAADVPTILVPSASVEAYKAAAGWSTYADKISGWTD